MNATLIGVAVGGGIAAVTQIVAAVVQDWLVRRREGRAARRDLYVRLLLIIQKHELLLSRLRDRESSPLTGKEIVAAETVVEEFERGYFELLVVAPRGVIAGCQRIIGALRGLRADDDGEARDELNDSLADFLVVMRRDIGLGS